MRCAEACEYCADACLGEADVKMMAGCVRPDRDCAEVCEACGAECGKHKHDHCQRCAEACRACAAECRKMAA